MFLKFSVVEANRPPMGVLPQGVRQKAHLGGVTFLSVDSKRLPNFLQLKQNKLTILLVIISN